MHVCNAVMLFAELQRAKNKAARVLLYPSAWDFKTEREDEAESVQRAETSKRLLQMAAERYKVVIQPVGPLPESADRKCPALHSPAISSFYADTYQHFLRYHTLSPYSSHLLNSTVFFPSQHQASF